MNGFNSEDVQLEAIAAYQPIFDVNSVIENHETEFVDSTDLLPFDLVAGELIDQSYFWKDGAIYLTSYRVFVIQFQCFHSFPIKCIEYVEMRELSNLHFVCKDGRVISIEFDSPDKCSEWWSYITHAEASQTGFDDLFAFKFYSDIKSMKKNGIFSDVTLDSADNEISTFMNDIKRMKFNIKSIWRTTEINSEFEVSKTYPKYHIVPAWITDKDLQVVARFRSLQRFPSVVWRCQTNGAVIARSSQPELGWFGWRCEQDENLLSAIANAASLDRDNNNHTMTLSVKDKNWCSSNDFLLLDARSYPAAVANRAKGGGCECQEYYPNCDIQFMGLPNIHAIRKSFQSVRALCLLGQDQSNWYSALESTRWLLNLSGLIRSSLTIVDAIHVKSKSTLVHCSDGWDRTSQLVSLAELLLDPYYRTMKGFRVLVEREWLDFGHKFYDRCGHSPEKDLNERSPVFFQWLDAIHQCMKQFPYAFEFNETFLVKLLQHVYGCLFGTFLCNNVRERRQIKLKNRTVSVWDLLLSDRKDFRNFLYSSNNTEVLYPSYHMRCLELWDTVFFPRNVPKQASSDVNRKNCSIALSRSVMVKSNGIHNKSLRERRLSADNTSSSEHQTDVVTSNGSMPIDVQDEVEVIDESVERLNGSISNGLNISSHDTGEHKELKGDVPKLNGTTNHHNIMTDSVSTLTSDSGDVPKLNGTTNHHNIMTDSVSTLTSDSEYQQHNKDQSTLTLDTNTIIDNDKNSQSQRQNGFHRAHTSPDSPTMNRLQRTKSVPDVMTASMPSELPKPSKAKDVLNQYSLKKDFREYIDIDGLQFHSNFYDEKLLCIHIAHSQELMRLQKHLQSERLARLYIQQHQYTHDGASCSPASYSDFFQDDRLSINESLGGERSSVSSISNDDGWEQVQFDDAQPTRWLPDHLSPACANCSCTFTLVYRKHHCRKCGGVFCDTCSNFKLVLPEEQLYNPVRVCSQCFDQNQVT